MMYPAMLFVVAVFITSTHAAIPLSISALSPRRRNWEPGYHYHLAATWRIVKRTKRNTSLAAPTKESETTGTRASIEAAIDKTKGAVSEPITRANSGNYTNTILQYAVPFTGNRTAASAISGLGNYTRTGCTVTQLQSQMMKVRISQFPYYLSTY